MANPTIMGTLLNLQQSAESDFDPQRGFVDKYSFKGTSLDEMTALQEDYIAAGIAATVHSAMGISSLSVNDSTKQFTVDTWEIEGDELNLNGFQHPSLEAILDPDDIAALRTDLDNTELISVLTAKLQSEGYSPGEVTTIVGFYGLQLSGATDFENDFDGSGYVLRHTTNVANRYLVNIADFNVGVIYSTAQLLTEAGSSVWNLPLPPRLAYKVNQAGSVFAAQVLPDRNWGWKKGRSRERTAANNRVDIVQNYVFGNWTRFYYPFTLNGYATTEFAP